MSFIFSPEYHVKGFVVSALRPIVYLIFHVPVRLKHNHASLSKDTLIVSMDGHIQGMRTTQRAKNFLWWLSTVRSEMWTRELYFQLYFVLSNPILPLCPFPALHGRGGSCTCGSAAPAGIAHCRWLHERTNPCHKLQNIHSIQWSERCSCLLHSQAGHSDQLFLYMLKEEKVDVKFTCKFQ